ncbi:Anti-sigma regulatory factor (Ser/Thr protein kinase) [Micromonospora pallida]|uniref:Anti-sigma regulatory factor (Ser/Thr protein kinase) n=1 Tax=Micromonospora pallida TaxID=145854 RepID=A0A1C6S203_9ACTN|nr:ATP-binding protein [Micromonospora pallida]SCL23428.1 Anti-sigma regulatory factor (Ser/Thr protein kinase) [Micromonospora pallida]
MGTLRTSPPPPQAVELRCWLLRRPQDLRALRASLHEALTGHDLVDGERLDEVPELVVLVATELATNALRHGLPPTIVTLSASDDYFYLDVADHDLSTLPELTHFQPTGSGGRGLQLALALSLDVGWYATDDSKHIWASFDR